MRKYLYIFCALLAWLVFSSRSCVPVSEQMISEKTVILEAKESIKSEFESDDLSQKSLRAFEEKARQKLIDFADYINIYFDESIDTIFKAQTHRMIRDLFVSDSVQINRTLFHKKDKGSILLIKFLEEKPSVGYQSIRFNFDSINIIEPLHRTDDYYFQGKLIFSSQIGISDSSNTAFIKQHDMEIDIIASKVHKTFGADTLQVWGVFLGDMK